MMTYRPGKFFRNAEIIIGIQNKDNILHDYTFLRPLHNYTVMPFGRHLLEKLIKQVF